MADSDTLATQDTRAQLSPAEYADVLSIVSHDIRAPLGVILGAVAELQDPRVGPLSDEQRKLLMLVRRGGERLTRLAANVLFLKRALGGVGVVPQRADLREIARRAIDLFERSGELTKVGVVLHAPPERVEVSAEPELLVQALVNVIANALRAGRREVSVTVSGSPEPSLTVDDDGPGLTEDVLATFFQAAAPLAHVAQARGPRGLGLLVVRGILDAHGARLTGESRVDDGGRAVGARVTLRMSHPPVTTNVP